MKIKDEKKNAHGDVKMEVEQSIVVHKMDDEIIEIDFYDFHFSLMNAYRRIIQAEVPTMAIEKVHMYNNTSQVPDEMLASRLGLLPLNVPPKLFRFAQSGDAESFSDDTAVKFELKVRCGGKSKPKHVKQEKLKADAHSWQTVDKLVTSAHLRWLPLGLQSSTLHPPAAPHTPPLAPHVLAALPPATNTDMVLAKLAPGQCIHLEAFAVKGIPSDHGKFCAGLAYYRQAPQIKLRGPIKGQDAIALEACFSVGSIRLEGDPDTEPDKVRARVGSPRYDRRAGNEERAPRLSGRVQAGSSERDFYFTIESHSALAPADILLSACDVLDAKLDACLSALSVATDL